MSKRISSAMADFIAGGGSWDAALSNGTLEFYSGTQPASADAAPTGTLLCVITKDGAAYTPETLATTTILLAGAAGSVDSLTIGGIKLIDTAVPFSADEATTAAAVRDAINARRRIHRFVATATGATLTITAPKNSGDDFNGMAVSCSCTTMTATINGGSSTTLGGAGATAGVSAVNGLLFKAPAAGKIEKAADTWRGKALTTNQAGWFRFKGHGLADTNGDDTTTKKFFRYDGSVGTVGTDMIASNVNFAEGADQTQSVFNITVSTAQ